MIYQFCSYLNSGPKTPDSKTPVNSRLYEIHNFDKFKS